MKLPPFTLVHNPRAGKQARAKQLDDQLDLLPRDLRATAFSIKPTFRRTLVQSALGSGGRQPEMASEALRKAVQELGRHARVETVGLWDLSSQVGGLPQVIQHLNEAQPVLTFFEVQASITTGLISRPERVIEWAKERAELEPEDLEQIESNVIFEDFSQRAEKVRRDLGLDYLVGFTFGKIAFEKEDGIYWNFFSSCEDRIVLVSIYDVYRYARKAKRPFEAAVAGMAVSQLLALINRLSYHPETRGCLFDFNEDRDSIVVAFRKPHIEPECLARIKPRYRGAAEALVTAIRTYSTRPEEGDDE